VIVSDNNGANALTDVRMVSMPDRDVQHHDPVAAKRKAQPWAIMPAIPARCWRAALRRKNPLRRSVPLASVVRKALLHARRRAGIRRAKGKPERAPARPVQIQALLGEARKLLQEMKWSVFALSNPTASLPMRTKQNPTKRKTGAAGSWLANTIKNLNDYKD
jgi:hypothetical protein